MLLNPQQPLRDAFTKQSWVEVGQAQLKLGMVFTSKFMSKKYYDIYKVPSYIKITE